MALKQGIRIKKISNSLNLKENKLNYYLNYINNSKKTICTII